MAEPDGKTKDDGGGRFNLKRLAKGVSDKVKGVSDYAKGVPGKLRQGFEKLKFHRPAKPGVPANFAETAKKILKDHPELSRKTLIINAATHKWTGSLRAKIKGRLSRKFQQQVKEAGQGPGSLIRGRHLDALVVVPAKDSDGKFALYQEAGQLLAPRMGMDQYFAALFGLSPAAGQASGDAYAVIRHLKEYGMDSAGLSQLSVLRAKTFLQTGDTRHLTSFVVDKILADRNFTETKPKDIVGTVQKYVDAYAPAPDAAKKLAEDFAPVRGKLIPPTEVSLKKLADITTNPQASPLAFYLGQRALGDYFRDSQGVDMTTEFWTAAKAAIAARLPSIKLEDMFVKPPTGQKNPGPKKPAP